MKKILSIFACMIFLASGTGITINSHYCGSKLSSKGFFEQECGCRKTAMKKNCCKNEIKRIKIAGDYSPSPAGFEFTKINKGIAVIFCFVFSPVTLPGTASFFSHNHSPPPAPFRDRVISFRSILV